MVTVTMTDDDFEGFLDFQQSNAEARIRAIMREHGATHEEVLRIVADVRGWWRETRQKLKPETGEGAHGDGNGGLGSGSGVNRAETAAPAVARVSNSEIPPGGPF